MKLYTSSRQLRDCSATAFASIPAMLLAAGLASTMAQSAQAAGFKIANIHFETNASACDMGIRIAFDTEGLTEGRVQDPKGVTVYKFEAVGGMKNTGGQTEGSVEGIKRQIKEIVAALGCGPSNEGVSTLNAFRSSWPPTIEPACSAEKRMSWNGCGSLCCWRCSSPCGVRMATPLCRIC